jgi:hypothetical protein
MNSQTPSKNTRIYAYAPEVIGGLVCIALSESLRFIGISSDVAWFAGIMSVLLPLTVVSTKHYVTTVLHEFLRDRQETIGRAARIGAILGEVDGLQFHNAQKVVDQMLLELEKINKGVISLDPSRYFHEIIDRMKDASAGTHVYAVNTIDELRWVEDPREVNFFQANLDALGRGVTINRIFVISRNKFFTGNPRQRLEILKQQAGQQGLSLWIVWKETLSGHELTYRDSVAFDNILFTDYADPIDHTRVSHGEMILNQTHIATFLSDFCVLRDVATKVDRFLHEVESILNTQEKAFGPHLHGESNPHKQIADRAGDID